MKFTIEISGSQDFDKNEFIRWLNDQLNIENDATGTDTKATLIET